MRKFLVSVIFSGLVVLFAGPVWSHAHLDAVKGPHGGQLVTAGHYHYELLAKDGELRLYVTDHNNHKILTQGGSGKANIFDKDGNKITSVELLPIFGNFMKGTGDFKITPETVISVFAVVGNTQTNAARFSSLVEGASSSNDDAAAEDEEHDHHHDDADDQEESDSEED
ncbi:hypothetical protein Nstercoris_00322 [Nitrosomonas stercoris]|uniref:Uncharacterized protein n=1 Tax=Nitrosomonas stercoris TaxID=1444684 RepID=A0A4Y1YMF9_9PROT|nr:hypothetical protein Nstercoris_00322 [Nitrosomonas stercoris]